MITDEIISVRTVTRNDRCDLDPLKKASVLDLWSIGV